MKKKIFIIACFFAGVGLILFPIISNHFNSIEHSAVIEEYKKDINKMSEEELERKKEEIKEYNKVLNTLVEEKEDPFSENNKDQAKISEYATIVNVGQAMGYISIASINVELPIYPGVSDTVLAEGVGHLPLSSLPVGGLGTHVALTGHRGLPTAEMFRNLDKLEIGDEFLIHTLNEVLAYKVDKTKIVLPNEMEDLNFVPGKDYITLITCEPYMINSHRLLVRGSRIPLEESKTWVQPINEGDKESQGTDYPQDQEEAEKTSAKQAKKEKSRKQGLLILSVLLILGVALLTVYTIREIMGKKD